MKTLLKACARALATVLVVPALVSFWIRGLVMGRDRALEASSQAFALIPGLAGQYARRAFLSHVLAECDPSAVVEFGTIFSKVAARLEANVYVGPRCHIGLAHLERDVLLGPAVQVPSGPWTHGFEDPGTPVREQPGTRVLVRIGAGSWIGANAVVMADVGRNTIVGAGAVVTSALPDHVVAAGVPARVVKIREASALLRGAKPA
jgi:virginiamycin A acetyltransferase